MGDLNCNTLPSSLNNANTQALLNIADIYNIKLITEPTRVTPMSSTLIYVIFTSHPDNVSCSGVSHVGISNHSLIYVFRKISFQSPSRELLLFRIGNLKILIVICFVRTSWPNRGLISWEWITPMKCG